MNVSLILGHPNPASFNHAIAETARATLRAHGHAVFFHDLYAEGFDPLMTSAELPKEAILPEPIERHCREIESAEGIVIVHPNWWSAPPAIIRGWVDRVLRAGRAYNFVPDDHGGARAVGLLGARVAMVFNTANTPQEKEESLFGDPLQTHWLKCVFGLCGIPTVYRRNFAPVILSTPDQRAAWLQDVREALARHFPRG